MNVQNHKHCLTNAVKELDELSIHEMEINRDVVVKQLRLDKAKQLNIHPLYLRHNGKKK